VAGLTLLGVSAPGQAAWVIDPALSVDSRYDDNVRLRPDDEDDVEAGLVTSVNAQARLRNVTEISEVAGVAGVGLSRYTGVDSFEDDTRETMFTSLSARRALARGGVGFNGSYVREDILRGVSVFRGVVPADPGTDDGEIPEPGPGDDLDSGGSGVAGSSEELVQRNYFSVSPNATWQATLRASLVVGYEDDPADEGLQEVQTQSVNTQYRYAVSERDTAWLEVQRSWFEPEINPKSDNWGVTVNWRRDLTERTRLTLGVGAQRTENDFDSQSGSLYSASLDHRLSRGNLNASVERAVIPNAYGDVQETDRASFRYGFGLTERLGTSVRLTAYRTAGSLGGQGNRDQDYFRVGPEVRWALTPEWSIRLAYDYTFVDRERNDGSASSNAITLAVNFAPPRRL
jgi:hypothetical protein